MTKTQQPELPALPDPEVHSVVQDSVMRTYSIETFSEHQMRSYAQAAVLADRESLLSDMDRAVLRMPFESAMGGYLAKRQFYSRVQSLLDRIGGKHETRKVVAWRYMPSPTWGEYVITQDPKVAEVARSMGVDVEELTVGATSKVEDKT